MSWRHAAFVSRQRLHTLRSPARRTLRSSLARFHLRTVSETTAVSRCRPRPERPQRIFVRRVTGRRRSCQVSRSIAGSGSIADSKPTTTICRKGTIGAGRRTSSGSLMRRPMQRSAGSQPRRQDRIRHTGSFGSTTTIRMHRTSRPVSWQSSSAAHHTTERSRSSIVSSGVFFGPWMRETKPGARSSS